MSGAKRKPLDVAEFASAALPQPDPVQRAITPVRPERGSTISSIKGPPSRANKVQIMGYFPEELRRRLKVLSAKIGRSQEDLLGEAINDLLQKRKG